MFKPLPRTVEPEWLDDLPPDDPRAVRSRRDLARVNRLMGSAGIIARVLRRHVATPAPRIAEVGAGDGTLLLRIVRACRWSAPGIVLVDRHPCIGDESLRRYRDLGCNVAVAADDIFEWLEQADARFDAIVTNLFLHHFEPPALARMFSGIARRTRLFVACEPRRARLPLAGSHLLGLLGCNDVTRHDAVLSVRAGFAHQELSALWPSPGNWQLEERPAGWLSHLFVASHPHPDPPASRGSAVASEGSPSSLAGDGRDGAGT